MQIDMFTVFFFFFCTSILGHIFYYFLEMFLEYPVLTPLRQLGFGDLFRPELLATSTGKRWIFIFNFHSFVALALHVSAVLTFPTYALAFAVGCTLTTLRTTYIFLFCGLVREKVNAFHNYLDTFKLYFAVIYIGQVTISTINRLNPFKGLSIRISRISSETYGVITIFGLAAALFYIVKKFYVKNEKSELRQKLEPQSNMNSRNKAAMNLGIMILSFVAFSDFSLWKNFSDWLRFQSFASSVFGNDSTSCKNYSDKKKVKGCSASEYGPSLCHGCCAVEAQVIAAPHAHVVNYDVDSVMANPPSYFPVLSKQIVKNPNQEIPEWFLQLPRFVQLAVFDGYFEKFNLGRCVDQKKAQMLSLEDFLAKRFTVAYNSSSNIWILCPLHPSYVRKESISSESVLSDSDFSESKEFPVAHAGNSEPSNPLNVEIDLTEPPKINFEEEIPLLKRVPKYLVHRIGFLVAMALIMYGLYLYNSKEDDKYVPPHKRDTRSQEHHIPSELYDRSESSYSAEHRGKVVHRQKQRSQADRKRDKGAVSTDTDKEELSPIRWYNRYKHALTTNYMFYDDNDLSNLLKHHGIQFFGPTGDLIFARTLEDYKDLVNKGYYCDPNAISPIAKGSLHFSNTSANLEIPTYLFQDMARGKPIRANNMQHLADLIENEDITLDQKGQTLYDSYTKLPGTIYYVPRNFKEESSTTKGCLHFCNKGITNSAFSTCNTSCGGHTCIHWSDCKPPVSESSEKVDVVTSSPKPTKPPMSILKRQPDLSNKLSEMTNSTLTRTCCFDERLCVSCVEKLAFRKAALCTTTPPVLTDMLDKALNDFSESSAAVEDVDTVCPFDGRDPGCRQIGCQLEHPSLKPEPEALNGVHQISHFPDKLATSFVAQINLRNPNDGAYSKQGTCYVTHSHISSLKHVFHTRDGKPLPIESLSVQFPGSDEQHRIDGKTLESVPFSLELNPPHSGDQCRFKLLDNTILATKMAENKIAPIGIPTAGETVYIYTIRKSKTDGFIVFPITSQIEDIKDGLIYIRSNTIAGDSGSPIVSARTGNVIATYWGRDKVEHYNLGIANDSEQLPFYASGQKLKTNFSHPSLRVTSQWRETF